MNTSSLSKSEHTRIRLLDAVEQLAASGPMSGITMRAVADEANCSLGLAYRYYETKEELLGAVLDRAASYITEGLDKTDSPDQLARLAWNRMAERPVFAQLFTWLVLEGGDVTKVMSGHPLLQILVQQAESVNDLDPMSAAAAIGIIIIGGALFSPAINSAGGNRPDDDAVYERLVWAVGTIPRTSSPRLDSPEVGR